MSCKKGRGLLLLQHNDLSLECWQEFCTQQALLPSVVSDKPPLIQHNGPGPSRKGGQVWSSRRSTSGLIARYLALFAAH
jgi:hypothetical protein